jgi:hypothetical protein
MGKHRLTGSDDLGGQGLTARYDATEELFGGKAGSGHDAKPAALLRQDECGRVRLRTEHRIPEYQLKRRLIRTLEEAPGQLTGRREPPTLLRGFLEQPRVRDRHPGGSGERRHQLLVVDTEGSVHALREVEVAEDPVPDADGDSEEALHRWMAVGNPTV